MTASEYDSQGRYIFIKQLLEDAKDTLALQCSLNTSQIPFLKGSVSKLNSFQAG